MFWAQTQNSSVLTFDIPVSRLYQILRKDISSNNFTAPETTYSSCPIDSFCLNGGTCLYYEFIRTSFLKKTGLKG